MLIQFQRGKNSVGLVSQEAFAPARDTAKKSATRSQTRSNVTLLYFCRVPNSLQLRDPDHARLMYYPRSLVQRCGGEPSQPRTDPGNSWASSRNSSPTQPPISANLCDPTLWSVTAALREVAVTDAPEVVSFCFLSLLSAARKTVKEQSRGGKPVS